MGLAIGLGLWLGHRPGATNPLAPANTVAPVVTGNTSISGNLTCSTGTWTNSPTYAYQWKRNLDGAITNVGTNSNTYGKSSADMGASIYCVVTATANGFSTPRGSNSIAIDPGLFGDLTLSGAITNGTTSSGTINGATSGSTITENVDGLTVNSGARTYAWDGTGSAATISNGLVESKSGYTTKNNAVTIGAAPAFTSNPAITYAEGADLNPGLVVAFDRGTATGAFGNFRLYKNGADFADASSGSGTLSSTGSYQLRSYLADNVTYALSNTVVIVEAEVGNVDAPVLSNPDDFVSGTNPPNTKVSITDAVDKSLFKLVGEWDNLASGGFSYDAGRTFEITDLPGFFGPEGTGETFAIAEYAALAAGPFPLNFRLRTKYVPLSGVGPSSPYSNTWTDTLNAVPVTYAAFDPAKRTLVSAALRGTLSNSNRTFSHDAGFDNEVLQIGGDQLLTSAIGVFEWRFTANAGGAFVGFANSANDFTARFNEWGATAGTFACAGGGDIVRAGSGSFVGFPASISVGAWAAWIVHKASNQAWLVHPNGTIYPNTPVFGADGSFTSGAGYATNLTSYYFGGNTKSIGDIFEINTGNTAFVRTMPAHTPTRWNGPPT